MVALDSRECYLDGMQELADDRSRLFVLMNHQVCKTCMCLFIDQINLSNDEILVMHHADTEMTDYDTYNRRFQSPQGVRFASYRGLETTTGSLFLLHLVSHTLFMPFFLSHPTAKSS
jgi:hypothetical protein